MRILRFSLLALFALPVRAQDTARIAPIVVTATRTPLPRTSLPVAVTVITAAELRLRGITSVADALNDITSASVVQTGSQGGQTSLFLRGGESKYAKVLIDGVPVNDPGGVYDFGSLTTDNIERIEVVRGPASVIYGADAVTGVVHIITRSGIAATPHGEIDLRVGGAPRDAGQSGAQDPRAMRSADLSAGAEGELTGGSYSIAIARHETNGIYAYNNRFLNNVLSGRYAFSPARGTTLRAALRYSDNQFNYPTSGGGSVTDTNSYRTEDRIVIGLEGERVVTSSIRAVLVLNSSVSDGGTDDAIDPNDVFQSSFVSQDKVRRRSAELRVHVTPVGHTLATFGAQIEQQDQRSQSQSQSSFGLFTSAFRAARRNVGGYAEVVMTPISRVVATLGARIDDNEQFGTFRTGRAGVSVRALPGMRIRATLGNAFREPSFFENYATGSVSGNPNLRPEKTRSADAGIDQDLFGARATVSATGFAQRFRDLIDFSGGPGPCGYNYCNVISARANGVEMEVTARLPWALSGSAGGTIMRTKVLVPGANDGCCGDLYKPGQSLVRRPEHKWSGQLTYAGASPLSANVRLLLVGQRTDRDFSSFPFKDVIVPGYQRTDLGAEYALRSVGHTHPSITLRVENLTDTKYQNVFNFLAPRRTISLGVRSSF